MGVTAILRFSHSRNLKRIKGIASLTQLNQLKTKSSLRRRPRQATLMYVLENTPCVILLFSISTIRDTYYLYILHIPHFTVLYRCSQAATAENRSLEIISGLKVDNNNIGGGWRGCSDKQLSVGGSALCSARQHGMPTI